MRTCCILFCACSRADTLVPLCIVVPSSASYFVATGASKADALLSIFGEQADTRGLLKAPSTWLPARRVRSHQTLFLVDPEAASKLPKRD